MLGMIKGGVTYLAVATDHVIESFRNDLWPGYKTSEGIEPDLLAQFQLLEETLSAAGIVVWPMVEFEADDALATAATAAVRDLRVEHVIICTPDKDLAQCVSGTAVFDNEPIDLGILAVRKPNVSGQSGKVVIWSLRQRTRVISSYAQRSISEKEGDNHGAGPAANASI